VVLGVIVIVTITGLVVNGTVRPTLVLIVLGMAMGLGATGGFDVGISGRLVKPSIATGQTLLEAALALPTGREVLMPSWRGVDLVPAARRAGFPP
jgi:hypothetical protein